MLNPFSLVNDTEGKVKLIIDKRITEAKSVNFHPMQNDALIEISNKDFIKFIENIGKKAEILDFNDLKKDSIKKPLNKQMRKSSQDNIEK